jgi:hypothetical protein
MQFSDLPNQGHNLRLYTYDPIGSANGPVKTCGVEAINTYVYNTGHFDITLGVPCSQPDPQGFCDWNTMSQYAAGRGEALVMVSRSDIGALCGYRAPVQVVRGPVQTIVGATTGAGPTSGTFTTPGITYGPGGQPTPGGIPSPAYIPPPGTPISDGGVPGGVGTAGSAIGPTPLSQLYRFILYNPSSSDPNNPYSTGANYGGCSQANTINCQGMNFPSEAAAVQYAEAHGEIPYRVLSAGEVWGVISGTIPIDPSRLLGQSSQGMSFVTLALIGAGLWFLSGR